MRKQHFVFICAFFFALGGNILGFYLIYRLADTFFFNPGQIGTFIALGQLAFFLGCNLYHRIGSAFDPIRVFPVAGAVAFLASIPIGFIRIEGVVYVSYWILQLGTGLFWPPATAWLTQGLDNKDLNREMSFFSRSWMSANMVGPLIAGALYSRSSGVTFLILILSYFLALLSLYFMRRYLQKHKEDKKPDSAISEFAIDVKTPDVISDAAAAPTTTADHFNSPSTRFVDIKLDLYRYRGWIGGFCSNMFLGVLINIVPLYIRDGLGLSEWSAGLLLFVRCVAGFIGFSLLAHFTAWHFNRRWFLIIQAGLILCPFLFIFAGNHMMMFFIIVIIYGLTNSASYNNSMFYSGTTGKNPKKNLALHEIFLCLGNATGTAGGGLIYQQFGFTGTCLALILVLGLGMAAFIFIERRDRIHQTRS